MTLDECAYLLLWVRRSFDERALSFAKPYNALSW